MLFDSLSASVDLLNILLAYAKSIGIDENGLIEECGPELSRLKQEEDRVPLIEFQKVWRSVGRKSGDPDFGLHFGQFCHNLLSRHLLYAMMMNCETVEQAMRKNFTYHNLVMDYIRPELRLQDGMAHLTWNMSHPGLKTERHFSESVIALFVMMLRSLTEDQIELTEVRFSHARPCSTKAHDRMFQSPLFFDRESSEVLISAHFLQKPILFANSEILNDLEKVVQKALHKAYSHHSWTEKTARGLIRACLKETPTTITVISGELALSERNLQLKLQEEGTTFRNLLDSVRKEIAVGYLKNRETTICEIALLLGFSDQSAFHHAFKRWTGMTPGEYRKHAT